MKLYKVTITPTSEFATRLKGDTLFGQMCWAIRYVFNETRLEKLLTTYNEKPFMVVSDAFPTGYLPKPKMPSFMLGEKREEKKENRKKIWLTHEALSNASYSEAKTNQEIDLMDRRRVSIHNALNYKTFHTGDGFDPYGLSVEHLSARDIYFLIDEACFEFEDLKRSLTVLSQMGYGKKTSIGKGRFTFAEDDIEEISMHHESNFFMTLSPFSLTALACKESYYEPFTRFGKFGESRAYKNAFKKPVLLADVASVIEFNEPVYHQYLGKAISNISDVYPDTVHQGYSIVVPIGVVK